MHGIARRTSQVDGRPRHGPRLSVGLILEPRFTLGALANFVDVLRLAADDGDRSRQIQCSWRLISHDLSPVTSSCGIVVQTQELLTDPAKFDYIAIVGGLVAGDHKRERKVDEYLRKAAVLSVPLIGLCSGSLTLHKAGLLSGYRCCVSWFHDVDFLAQFEGVKLISNQIFVVDRDRLTCSGGTSTAHLAAFLVDRHVGKSQAMKSLHIMMISEAEMGEAPQPGSPLIYQTHDPIVKKALLFMQQTIDTPVSVAHIASKLKVNRKLLERRFKAALGITPSIACRGIRLQQVRHLLETTDRQISSIAIECGFCDASHLSRQFRAYFGSGPQQYRENIKVALR